MSNDRETLLSKVRDRYDSLDGMELERFQRNLLIFLDGSERNFDRVRARLIRQRSGLTQK